MGQLIVLFNKIIGSFWLTLLVIALIVYLMATSTFMYVGFLSVSAVVMIRYGMKTGNWNYLIGGINRMFQAAQTARK